jgi:hypothetical protein
MKISSHIKITIFILGLLLVIGYQTSNGYAFFTGILGLIFVQLWLDIVKRIESHE